MDTDNELESIVNSVWDEDIDLDEWTAAIDQDSKSIETKVKNLVSKETTLSLENMYSRLYDMGASIVGMENLDRIMNSCLNSTDDIKSITMGRTDVDIVFEQGNVYARISAEDDEEIDGYTIGTVKDSTSTDSVDGYPLRVIEGTVEAEETSSD